jgi:hypothetical protein
MRAFLTSIGETTTKLCASQLKKYGYEVVVLDKIEPWFDKYKRFIETAKEDCIRIDADIIPNKNIALVPKIMSDNPKVLMAQFNIFDFYKMDVGICSPVFYKKQAIEIIKNNLKKIDHNRPEATAWRLKDINSRTKSFGNIMGIHGYKQKEEEVERAIKNKTDRRQIKEYDFELYKEIMKL